MQRNTHTPTHPHTHTLLSRFLPPLLLILAGVLAYWNSFDGVFVYDDIESIRDNPHIRVLWPLSEAMSLPLWNTAFTVDGRPLLSLSFALNHALFGPEPWGYHLVNLVIHIAAGLLLFGIVRRTLALSRFRERYARSGIWLALATALIWLVHPLQTGSVTYIVQRAESLMGMLFLLTMYCAIRGFTGEKSGRWYIAAVLACACGTGVKEIIFAAPLLVLLYDYIFTDGLALPAKAGQAASLPRSAGRGLQRAVPVARARLPSVLSSKARRATEEASEARRMGRARGRFYAALFATWSITFAIKYLGWSGATSYFAGISPLRYALTQPLVLLHYLRLVVWPDPLVLAYGWPLEDQWPRIVFPGLVIVGMLAVMLRGIWKRRWYGFVLAWFFLILAPTSSIAPMRQAIFEHRIYLSLAAVVMLAVVGGEHAIRRLCAAPKQRVVLGVGLALALVIVLGCRTHARNRDYRDDVGFWQDNVAHRPLHPLAHLNLGCAVEASGRPLEAIPHFREALRLKPDYAEAHYNWGVALDAAGRTQEALDHYQQALQLKPDYAQAHNNLGNALLVAGHPREAAGHCREALRLRPGMPKAYNNLGNALLALNRPQEAIAHYREALRLDPGNAEAHYNWGIALDAVGQPREAMEHYQEAVQMDPNLADARYNLGNALLALGHHREASEHYRQVVQLKPDHAEAHNNLGITLHSLGHTDEAIAHFEQALRLKPDYTAARDNLRKARELLSQ
ncbi:MAG: tetratricopeptide repeat protein [Verrucomicrobia bacterium]|jgi:protein O-mannosyl-transferase|nr:tetratricopeptide repeat protein [Verrucomicrobiota bacterium]MBT7065411.1 tetratricopeptide repeat protein [Verrucomicrobiota bacterium]MBT7702143.1 tetratricopeptide repeat protein [Verrucomicrobiota bacterium]